MKRIAFLVVLVVLAGMTVNSWGHLPVDVMYYAFQFPDDRLPVLDGDLSEWDIVPEAYVIRTEEMYELYSGMGKKGDGVDLRDFATRAIVGWNDTTNRLYFMAEVFDDVHQTDRAIDRWDDDSWNITIDADHSGGRYLWWNARGEIGEEEAKRLHYAQATWYGLAEPPVQGVDFVGGGLGTWATERGEFFDVGWDFRGNMFGESTYLYELFIRPFDDLNWMGPEVSEHHDLKEGEIIGLEYHFTDYDLSDRAEASWGLRDRFGESGAAELADFYLCPVDPVFAGLRPSSVDATFSASVREGEAPLAVRFTDESVGEIVHYVWDFGDGAKSRERSPEHTYRTPGVYTVTLEAIGPEGMDREEKDAYIAVRGRISEIGVRIPRVPALPGERIRVPLLVDDITDQEVISLDLSVEYEEEWLTVVDVETEGTLLEKMAVRYETMPGSVRIEVTGDEALAGEGALVFLAFQVSRSAEPGRVSPLRLVEVIVNGEPAGRGEEGGVGVTMAGDVSHNYQITGYDAALVVLVSVGVIKLPDPDYPNLRFGVGDMDGDGDMDEVDAALMLRLGAEEGDPSLPDVRASLGWGEVDRREEGILAVPIVVSELEDVRAGRISLTIEGKRKPAGIIPGDGIPGYVFGHRMELGHWGEQNDVHVAFAGRESSSGPGRIVELHFDSKRGAMGMIRLKEAKLNGEEARIVRGEIDLSGIPETYRLYPNYPNPFNVGTTIEFDLPERGEVELSVWDMLGQRVRRLVGGDEFSLGRHEVVWDGRDDSGGEVGSGVYVCRLRVGGFSQVRKMIMIR